MSHMCRTVVSPCLRLRVGQLAMMLSARRRTDAEWVKMGAMGCNGKMYAKKGKAGWINPELGN